MIFLLSPVFVRATNYYISNEGNDDNKGTSPTMAWRSISKLNTAFKTIQAGDSIFFKRGNSFYGSMIISAPGTAGKPIVITAYGKGADAVITGFTTITGFTKKDGGIWEAPAGNVRSNLNMVTINGLPQRIGRYPNADAVDGGYLRYENFTGSSSIMDNDLKRGNNWEGAEVIIRKNHWTAERCRVTNHNGNNIFYNAASYVINGDGPANLYDGTKGNGYFFQNDSRTLDQFGEWYFDHAKKAIQLFFGKADPSSYDIQVSTVDTLINAGNMSFINIEHLSFEGANMSAIYCRSGSDITVRNCDFSNIGAKAIHIWNTANVLLENLHTNYILSNAIQVRNGKQDNVTVRNCVIKNTAPFIGMGSFFDDRDYKAMSIMVNDKAVIENNVVDTVGLTGIQFHGNNVTVKNNFVNYFCYLLDDGAGIYTHTGGTKEIPESFVNRNISDNIILHGIGAPEGSTPLRKAEGIYLDGRTMNVDVINNTIAYVGNKAIAMNNPVNVTIRNNTCFNNGGGWGAARINDWEEIHNLEIKNNIFYSLNDQQTQVTFAHSGLNVSNETGLWETIQVMGQIDSNYYNTSNPAGFNYSYAPAPGKAFKFPSPLTFENWRELTNHDKHSKRPAKIIPSYVLKNITGTNKVTNGDFKTDMNAVNIFGSNTTGKWDNTAKITGEGSLRIDFTQAQANRYGLVFGDIGNVAAGTKFIFRFNTLGTSECGIVRAYLRKTASPYNSLVPVQTKVFGLKKQPHEFLFDVNKNESASYVIEIEKNSGTTYIDDIQLFEANATVINIADQVRFEYNSTNKTVTMPLDKNYVGVDGTSYKGSLTLEPFRSKILIADVKF
jgi:hypothetical protein